MPVKLSESQRARLLRQVRSHYDRALKSRGDFPTRHADRYRRFNADVSLRPPGPWRDSARLFVPVTRDIAERTQSIFHQTLFGNLDTIRVDPLGEEDVTRAERASRFLRWGLTRSQPFLRAKASIPAISYTILQDALLDSVGVMKIYHTRLPWTPPTQESKRFLQETVQIDALDLGLFLAPPDAEGLQFPQAEYVQQEIWLTWDGLRRLATRQEDGYRLPDLPDKFSGSRTKDITDRKRAELERDGQALDVGEGFWTLMVECYERFALEEKGLEEDVIVSWLPDADDAYQIARVATLGEIFPVLDRPLRPFFPVTVWPQPRQWRGMNVPDRLLSLQDIINRLHEQMINYGEVSILPFFFFNAYLTGDIPSLRQVRPGEGVPVDDTGNIQFVQRGSLNRHFIETIQQMQGHAERDSHITDFNQGRQSDRPNQPRTYGATIAMLQESRQAFAPLITHIGGQFSEALSFYFALWQKYLPYGLYAPIYDRQPVRPVVDPFDTRTIPMQSTSPGRYDAMGGPASLPALESLSPSAAKDLVFRLFGQEEGQAPSMRMGEVTRSELSGLFDVTIDVNPNSAFDRQILMSMAAELRQELRFWPIGKWELWKHIWTMAGQHGFERYYPRQVAELETAAVMRAAQGVLSGQMAPPGAGTGAPEQGGMEPAVSPTPGGLGNNQPPSQEGMLQSAGMV